VSTFLGDIQDVLVPDRDSEHGPLAPLLLSMTLVTGLVDAFSYLALGHVFVANMTGNVVFLGFALVGAPGFSITASLVALAAFAAGALLGGRIGARHRDHRARLHATAAGFQTVLLAVAAVLALAGGGTAGSPLPAGYRYALIVVLGASMGLQNATSRQLAIPDLTTTVLTLTITGIAADSAVAGGQGSRAGRRLLSIATMLVGALIGATLVLHAHIVFPLVIAFIVIAAGAAVTWRLGRSDPAWVRPAKKPGS
jgi:uncharacterized membrane protein YoaK (UPF0700 family)